MSIHATSEGRDHSHWLVELKMEDRKRSKSVLALATACDLRHFFSLASCVISTQRWELGSVGVENFNQFRAVVKPENSPELAYESVVQSMFRGGICRALLVRGLSLHLKVPFPLFGRGVGTSCTCSGTDRFVLLVGS